MKVSLQEVNADNFNACIGLSVAKHQRSFVAENVKSIAQSKVYPYLIPLAIYRDKDIVGFTLHGKDPESKNYYIVRLMIDEKFQGCGLGGAATLELVKLMNEYEDCNEIRLFFVPENTGAEKLYENLGFRRTGKIDEESGEIEMSLDLTSTHQ